jgi:hypothetical protein
MTTSNKTGFEVSANTSPFESAMRRMVEAARGGQGGVASALGNLGGPLKGLSVAFEALGALAAGAFLKNAIDQTAQMTEKAMDLSRALGISTNEARSIQMALADIGAEQGEFEGAAKGMVRQLRENEAELNRMGLTTRDATGHLRPLNDLVLDGIQVLGTYREGTDRTLASQALFGRGLDASSKLMLLNQQAVDESRQAMQELGLEVGSNAVAAWQSFDAASDRAGFGLQGLQKAIGDALMPVLTTLVEMFNSAMPAAIVTVRGVVGGLASAFLAVRNGVVVLWETINAFVYSVVEPLRGLMEMMGRAMVGDFSGAAAAFRSIGQNVGDVWQGALDRMAASSRRTADEIYGIFARDSAAGDGGGPGAGSRSMPRKPPKQKADAKKGAADFMGPQLADTAYYEQMLERERLLATQQDALREYGKAQELAYWRDVLQTAELAGKDRVAIQRKVVDLELQILREQAGVQQALQAEDLQARRNAALDAVEMARLEAAAQVQEGTLSRAQLLELERQFEAQRAEIQRQYLQARLAQIDPTRDPVAYAQANQQIEELERQHQLRLRQIQVEQAAEVRANNPLAAVWDGARNAMEQSIQAMLQRGQTLRQGLAGIWQGIRGTITGEIAKIAAAKVVAFAKERVLALAGIGTDAAKAGAGAAASQASIPYVGPALALAALATVTGAVLALQGSIPSAAGGWDIPAGVDPIAQLHEREMVLPQGPADVIRNLADEGGGRPREVTVELKAAPMPSNFFMVHKDELVRALKSAHRDGHAA